MANLSDKNIKRITITAIGLYAAALIAGLAMHHLLLFVSIINIVAGVLVFNYWIWYMTRPLKRFTENRELIFLLAEGLFFITAVYDLFSAYPPNWLAILQYIIFTLHALLLILFLLFMLTFKIKKLF